MEDNNNGWIVKKRKLDEEFWKDHPLQNTAAPAPSSPPKKTICSLQEEDTLILEQVYRRKIGELKRWKAEELKSIETRYKGLEFHYLAPTQFQIPNGKTACTCIAIVTAYEFLTNPPTTPVEMEWETTMKWGRDLWEIYSKYNDDVLATVYNVIQLKEAKNFRKRISASEEIAGRMDIMELDMDKAVQEGKFSLELAFRKMRLLASSQRFAVAFTARQSTITLLYTNHWWLFDSHGVDKNNKSTLISFDQVNQLISFLRHRNGINMKSGDEECDIDAVFCMTLFTLKQPS